jgi:ribonuclease HII
MYIFFTIGWEGGDFMGFRIGVDEAGRGSLVGELFVVAFAMRDDDEKILVDYGVRDSKKLSRSRRAELYAALRRWPFTVSSIAPRDIDLYNINKLELNAVFAVLRVLALRLGGGFAVSRIVVDKFGDVERELSKMLKRINFTGTLIVEEDADSKYVEVSAASIIAKHLRDRRLQVLRSIYGIKGSGYPSDPRTLEWLEGTLRSGARPPIIRYSWATLERFGLRAGKTRLTFKTLDEYLE